MIIKQEDFERECRLVYSNALINSIKDSTISDAHLLAEYAMQEYVKVFEPYVKYKYLELKILHDQILSNIVCSPYSVTFDLNPDFEFINKFQIKPFSIEISLFKITVKRKSDRRYFEARIGYYNDRTIKVNGDCFYEIDKIDK